MTTKQIPRPDRDAIATLFEARSVAVIGASADPTKLSSSPLNAMNLYKYQGTISVVNPKHDTLQGYKCYKSVAELPDGIEAAIVILPAALAVEVAEACVAKGILSLVVIAQGFGEAGPEGKERDQRLLALTRDHGAAIVGPNTNGITNVVTGLALSIAPIMQYEGRVKPGRVGVICQSGAMVSSLLTQLGNCGLGVSKTATCGNELVLTVADYLMYLCDDPDTDTIVLYLETIRGMQAFRAALDCAQKVGKQVIAIKVGESASGQKAALSHTGALAGSYRNTIALLEHHGVYVADDLETLAAITECLTRFDWSDTAEPGKPFIASISGGFAVQTADVMARLGMPLQDPSDDGKNTLESLPTQSHGVNPYDIAAQNELIPHIIDIFRQDGFDQLLFGLVLLKSEIYEGVKQKIVLAKEAGMAKTMVLTPKVEAAEREFFNAHGIILHENPVPLLKALRAIEKHRALAESRKTSKNVCNVSPTVDLPLATGLIDEARSKAILTKIRFRVPLNVVLPLEGAPTGYEHLRYPLVMKGLSDKIAHKTEHGLVALGVKNANEVEQAWAQISAALAKADPDANEILLEEMVATGIEAIVGVERDPIIGPVVVVGAGGILCELLDDAVVLLPPFSPREMEYALSRTKFGQLLAGFRGRRYDIDALARSAAALGALALCTARIASIDVNPVLVQPDDGGLVAVDAKIVLTE
ncbi:MAG: acetate--CoA ligase family protein [Gammaproteobacteria bacterium]|nr:acetate--CoA ligase family protein [Gammaproteobacteria bacterium]